ncbi:MAG: MFS transporter [Anaerolineae bacterium]|nr:MFS transporter [Anaerolineae bacterium]
MNKKPRYSKAQIINAWCMYDWANSAFATTIMAAVLPIYYSQVAGATLPSEAVATAYWSIGLSVSLLIVAVLSPILGTISDVIRSKKRFLTIFASLGIVGTGMLVLVDTGDWLLASLLFVVARGGFTGANVFYDSLLPHVATEEEQDSVSTRGYAMGYLGGGVLLAINVVMIQLLPGNWGARLSFVSVAVWWALFSIPILRRVPEPPSATATLAPGENVVTVSLRRLLDVAKDISRYRELFKYLIAFLIYTDAIGTIIGVAGIYGAELGFGSIQLILALLLVQFVGIPFSLIFGRLPSKTETRRPFYLAFIAFNLVMIPLTGIVGARVLPATMTGAPVPPYAAIGDAVGEGQYRARDAALDLSGAWTEDVVSADILRAKDDAILLSTNEPGAALTITLNGQEVEIRYSVGPAHGRWAVEMDGQPLLDPDSGSAVMVDGYNATPRYNVPVLVTAPSPGLHTLTLVNTSQQNPASQGTLMAIQQLEVLPPQRAGNLGVIMGLIVAVEGVGLVFAWLTGHRLFAKRAEKMDTRGGIILALVIYAVVAVWGFFLNSVIEFWFLALMVAVVQGGSQALSRSLYATLTPATKSGEFFGLFGVMEKFSSILGPLVFAAAAQIFGSSRPAILSLILFFFIGIVLLLRVDIEHGTRVARDEDRAAGLYVEENP